VRKPKGQCRFAVVPWRCQAKLLVPENSEIDIFQLDGIPMFNEDDESNRSGCENRAHAADCAF